ncbi:hypothetical protein DPMN_183758 [Dreissena polymorpha]|uniref:Uncharacterized protein n=1 Tax=Dreissena polymorpha TaxID=45954 RepID=A0A9D4DH78_DREPO|nr:hypothetical protein DPMN_183758 [Dreissena polymorpha]
MKCPNPNCGSEGLSKYCEKCGTNRVPIETEFKQIATVLKCQGKNRDGSACLSEITIDVNFCGNCGTQIEKKQLQVEPDSNIPTQLNGKNTNFRDQASESLELVEEPDRKVDRDSIQPDGNVLLKKDVKDSKQDTDREEVEIYSRDNVNKRTHLVTEANINVDKGSTRNEGDSEMDSSIRIIEYKISVTDDLKKRANTQADLKKEPESKDVKCWTLQDDNSKLGMVINAATQENTKCKNSSHDNGNKETEQVKKPNYKDDEDSSCKEGDPELNNTISPHILDNSELTPIFQDKGKEQTGMENNYDNEEDNANKSPNDTLQLIKEIKDTIQLEDKGMTAQGALSNTITTETLCQPVKQDDSSSLTTSIPSQTETNTILEAYKEVSLHHSFKSPHTIEWQKLDGSMKAGFSLEKVICIRMKLPLNINKHAFDYMK